MSTFTLPGFDLAAFVRSTLDEDLGVGLPGGGHDVTAESVIPADARFSGVMDSRDAIVVAGLPIAAAFFRALDPAAEVVLLVEDGATVGAGTDLMRLTGNARALLTAERRAPNTVPADARAPSSTSIDIRASGSSTRKKASANGRPATTMSSRLSITPEKRAPAGITAADVMSPPSPRSSASVARTNMSTSSSSRAAMIRGTLHAQNCNSLLVAADRPRWETPLDDDDCPHTPRSPLTLSSDCGNPPGYALAG